MKALRSHAASATRFEQRARSRRMNATVLNSVSSPHASPIRPRAVAAEGGVLRSGVL